MPDASVANKPYQLIAEARQHLETSLALLSDVPREIAPIFLPLAMVRRESERMSWAVAPAASPTGWDTGRVRYSTTAV